MKTIFTTVAALQAANIKSQGAIMAMPFTDQDMALKAANLAASRVGMCAKSPFFWQYTTQHDKALCPQSI